MKLKLTELKWGGIEVNSPKLIKNVPVITYNGRSILPVDSWIHEEFGIYANNSFFFINEEEKKVLHISVDHPFRLSPITLEKLKDYQSVVVYSEFSPENEANYTIIEIC